MGRMKCQVCGGPVVKGRCKLCGMPYRNDDVLYHLNENRRDHYSHASEKAKQEMRKMEIPLGDKKTLAGTSKDSAKIKEDIKKQQQKVRQEAVNRINTAQKQSSRTVNTYQNNKYKRNTASTVRNQKKKKSSWITILILIIILLCSLLPSFLDYVREQTQYNVDSIFETDTIQKLRDYGFEFDL